MTTDQSNSELCASHACNLGAVNFADSSDDAVQSAHMWDVRGRLRNIPALTLRVPLRGPGNSGLHPSSTGPTGRINAEPSHCQSQTEQLLACAYEDISRLNEILRTQQCTAAVCGVDGVMLPPDTITTPIRGGRKRT